MGCSSSAAVKSAASPAGKDAPNGKSAKTNTNDSNGQTPRIILESEERANSTNELQTLHSVGSLSVEQGRRDKGDGISTQSLNSKLTIEESARVPKSPRDADEDTGESGTAGQQDAASIASQLILDKALKELSQSLFESTEFSASKSLTGTPMIDTKRDHAVNSVRANVSPALSGDSTLTDDGINVAVIDVGSGFCKAGLSGDDIPSVVIPTVVGRQKKAGLLPGIDANQAFIGKEAKLRKDALEFTRPVNRGVVTNWEDTEKVYGHILQMELNLEPNEHGVVLPASPFTSREGREKLTELMFEKFQSKNLYMASSAPLALHALGLSTGLVVSLGHGVSYALPVIQGNAVAEAVQMTKVGNEDIIRQMDKVLQGMNVESVGEDISRSIVEKMCYVSKNYAEDMKTDLSPVNKTYNLPSGKVATLGRERFTCPEVLFNPSLIPGSTERSLVDICRSALDASAKVNPERTSELRQNIVLVGGTSMMPGVSDRLKLDLLGQSPDEPTCVLTLPGRQYASWRGASMLTTLRSSRNRWIDKMQYEEHGTSIIHRKFL